MILDAPEGGAIFTSDRLEMMFHMQAALARIIRHNHPDTSPEGLTERILVGTRAIVHECAELDNETNWKPWKNGRPTEETRAARLVETVDILHFVIQLFLDQGFDAGEVWQAYREKYAENISRQLNNPAYQGRNAKELGHVFTGTDGEAAPSGG